MQPKRSGFSLIELLMVLAVMAILMGMLVPSVGVIRHKAQRMATAQKLRQIGLAVATYQSMSGRSLTGTDLADWMSRLAAETGVREGELFLFNEDPLLSGNPGAIPPVLVEKQANGQWGPIGGFQSWPVGVAVVSGLNPMAHPSSTPVAWTRGLNASGQWEAIGSRRAGIYGDEGGYIVFLDGHVEFHRDLALDGGQLVQAAGGGRTSDIRDALTPGAVALDYLGPVF